MRKITEHDINAIVGTYNDKYKILMARIKEGDYIDSRNYGVVLAISDKGRYVTWQFHMEDEKPSYYWGHYIENSEAAENDFLNRE